MSSATVSPKPRGRKPKNTNFSKNVQEIKDAEKRKKKNRQVKKINKKPAEKIQRVEEQLAPGVSGSVQIQAAICTEGVQTAFTGLISYALSCGYKNTYDHPIYWAYLGLLRDFINIANAKVGNVVVRAKYLNEILAAFTDKTVPFGIGKISYRFTGLGAVAETPLIEVNGYAYLMYVPDGSDEAIGNRIYIPPQGPTTQDQIDSALLEMLMLLSNTQKSQMFKVERDPKLGKIYAKDTSPYARSAPYHGSGSCTSGGPWSSAESEVPFKSRILTTFCEYNPDQKRSSRVLKSSSGDSCFAFTCPILPQFEMRHYDTAFPPVFKFIDFDEIIVVVYSWYKECVTKYLANSQVDNDNFYLQPFQCTYLAFYIAFRQQILRIFGNSQCCAQYLSNDVNTGSFRPFKVGSNCYPKSTDDGMLLPLQLLENLRFLAPAACEQKDGKYISPRNVRHFVPVLGRYDTNVMIEPTGYFWGDDNIQFMDMFQPDIGEDPNVIDGSLGNNYVDLNGLKFREIIIDWNRRVSKLAAVCGAVGNIGDAGSNAISLLHITRYNGRTNSDLSKFSDRQVDRLPKYLKDHVIELKASQKKASNLTKTKSQTPLENKKNIRNYPSGTTLMNIETNYVTCDHVITQTLKSYIKYLVLPQVCLVTNNFDLSEIQVETQECYHYTCSDQGDSAISLNVRQIELENLGVMMAPGIANPGNTELDKVYAGLLAEAKGGFLGDLLTGAGNLAGVFGL